MIYTQERQLCSTVFAQINEYLLLNRALFARQKLHTSKENETLTETDIICNTLIIDAIHAAFPADSIASEESPLQPGSSGRTWYIDPLDGSTNFAYGMNEFCVCIGLVIDETPVFGAIFMPSTHHILMTNSAGNGITINDQPVQKTKKSSTLLQKPLICTDQKNLKHIATTDKTHLRIIGATGIELGYIATGIADISVVNPVRLYDVIAGIALIQATQGSLYTHHGTPWTIHDQTLIACSMHVENFPASLLVF